VNAPAVSIQRRSGGFSLPADRQCAFADLDPMQHVNNAVYATYFEPAALP